MKLMMNLRVRSMKGSINSDMKPTRLKQRKCGQKNVLQKARPTLAFWRRWAHSFFHSIYSLEARLNVSSRCFM